MAPKRKASSLASVANTPAISTVHIPDPTPEELGHVPKASPPPLKRQRSSRRTAKPAPTFENDPHVIDGQQALRASPDHDDINRKLVAKEETREDSPLSDVPEDIPAPKPAAKAKAGKGGAKKATKPAAEEKKAVDIPVTPAKSKAKGGVEGLDDPEADGAEEADEEELTEALSRPPPVNSDYLPLPWKGRLGYVSSSSWA